MALSGVVAMLFGVIGVSPALAFGQCGKAVHNGQQLYNAWARMGVQNDPQALGILKAAGWRRMDGSAKLFMSQRGREFKLARPADIEDFGCKPGDMYSVGKRHYGKGEHVIAIVPSKYDPGRISGHPHKGWKRILIWVHVIGRGNCANGFKNLVLVYAYVPRRRHHHKPPPHVSAPAVSAQAQACVEEGGTSGIINGSVTNPNSKSYTIVVRLNGQTAMLVVPAGASSAFTFTGFAPGTYTGTATLKGTNKVAGFSVTVEQCSHPSNGPPTGHLDVPKHLIVNGIGKVSVDSISDPDGDPVTVSFTFKDVNGNTLDLSQGPVFSDGPGVVSMMIKAPSAPTNVYVYATLSDGKNPPVMLPVGSFPVVADPDPSN